MRDKEGRSLRTRCFEMFEQGQRPAAVAEELSIKAPTVCRYFRDWQRLGPNFKRLYAFNKELFKKNDADRYRNIESFARRLGITKEQFQAILSQPHGLRQFVTGKLHFPVQAEADHKRHLALELSLLLSDHLINNNGRFHDVYFALKLFAREPTRS
jgi:hypothetical protein